MKKEIMKEAFEYLRSTGKAHIQQDIANKMGISKTNVSRVFNGDGKYLTKNFLHRFNEAYGNVFNYDWLLTGDGEMLTSSVEPAQEADSASREKDITMNLNERLQVIVDKYFNGDKDDFAKAINTPSILINNILGNRKPIPSAEILVKTVKNIPEINLGWLISGKGEMLNNKNISDEKENESESEINPSNNYKTYLLPLSAMGGSLTGFAENGVLLENCEAIVSPIANVDFAITVYGDSMSPEYPSGSRILIKKINPDLFIDWGKAYVLDTPNGVILKEIRESTKEGYIRCYSINPDPKYQPFDVPMQEIYGMYRVLMSLSAK